MNFSSLRDIRNALGLSLEQLSEKSGRKVSSLSDMERRELQQKVSLSNIDALSKLMKYKIEYSYLQNSTGIESKIKYATLQEVRESLGISLRALSKSVDKSHSTLCELESREKNRKVTIQTLQKISRLLGFRLEYSYKPERRIPLELRHKSILLATQKVISDELRKQNGLNNYTLEELKDYVSKVANFIIKGDTTMKLYHPIKDLSTKILLRDYYLDS